MAITSSFANLATVTRASKKTDAGGWDFTNGGTVGTLTEYASGVASLHATAGLLVEEASTNEIRNPRFEGGTLGVFGSGGVPPTNLSYSMPGCSLELTATGTENGWNFAEFRISGTPTASPYFHLENGVSAVPALTGETHTTSIGVRVSGGTLANISGVQINNVETTAGAGIVAGNAGSVEPLDTFHRRFFLTTTLSGGGTVANLRPRLQFMWTSGAIDITVRLFAPQCENNAYPTSPILPEVSSPAATTRAADSIVMANGAWSNDNDAGTIYADFTFNYDGQASTFPRVFGYGSDASNRVDLYRSEAAESVYMLVTDGGTQQAAMTTSTAPASTDKKVALAFDANDFALSVSGGVQQTDTSGTVTLGSSAIELGQGAGSGNRSAALYLRDLRYWPRRLSNAELEALVGN